MQTMQQKRAGRTARQAQVTERQSLLAEYYDTLLQLRQVRAAFQQVTDPELIEKTGGIVQGMSGSPIIQDGKLIGAVTHVLVNDPTTGYGIFIENMLDAAG